MMQNKVRKTEIEQVQIPMAEISDLRKLLFFALHIEVSYDESQLFMTHQAIARMKGRLVKALGTIDPWLNPTFRSWPKVRDLPADERELFAEWMAGRARPRLAGEKTQDGYYPQDYGRWHYEKHNRYQMCEDQPAQISCLVENCIYHKGKGQCANISPAITLKPNGKFICLSRSAKPSEEETEAANAHH